MKKVFLVIILVIGLVVLSSCGKESAPQAMIAEETEETIIQEMVIQEIKIR